MFWRVFSYSLRRERYVTEPQNDVWSPAAINRTPTQLIITLSSNRITRLSGQTYHRRVYRGARRDETRIKQHPPSVSYSELLRSFIIFKQLHAVFLVLGRHAKASSNSLGQRRAGGLTISPTSCVIPLSGHSSVQLWTLLPRRGAK